MEYNGICRLQKILSPDRDLFSPSAVDGVGSVTSPTKPLSQLQNLSTYGATVMLEQATQSSPATTAKLIQTNNPPRVCQQVCQQVTQTDHSSPTHSNLTVCSSVAPPTLILPRVRGSKQFS